MEYEEYNNNQRFRDYVNKYCRTYKCTVEEALQHELVRSVYMQYKEEAYGTV